MADWFGHPIPSTRCSSFAEYHNKPALPLQKSLLIYSCLSLPCGAGPPVFPSIRATQNLIFPTLNMTDKSRFDTAPLSPRPAACFPLFFSEKILDAHDDVRFAPWETVPAMGRRRCTGSLDAALVVPVQGSQRPTALLDPGQGLDTYLLPIAARYPQYLDCLRWPFDRRAFRCCRQCLPSFGIWI
jgi:hypothetical protein